MDKNNSIATSILIKGENIIALNSEAISKGVHAKIIDLKGKTVVPGLIDSHIHFLRQGLMPGNPISEGENIFSVQSLLDVLKDSSKKISSNQWITIVGGIDSIQFKEKRLPTLMELDKEGMPNPVYIQIGFSGPCVVNSTARKYFVAKDIKVDDKGYITSGSESVKAFMSIKSFQSEDDKIQTTRRLSSYANSVGLTTIIDEAGTAFKGAAYFDPYNDYNTVQNLWRQNNLTVRVRIQHVSQDSSAAKQLLEERIAFGWNFLGDEMLKITGTGEHLVSFPQNNKVNPAYYDKGVLVIKKGFSNEQHSTSYLENEQHVAMIEKINQQYPIQGYRWSLSHVFELGHSSTASLIDSIKALGLELRLQNQGYLKPTNVFPLGRSLGGDTSGPYFKTLFDKGFILGGGTDGPLLGPMNPWLSIYYMITGKNAAGKLVNPGQQLTRLEALKLYTIGSAWFSFDEKNLGSIEVGKKADIVILNQNFLSVSDEAVKTIRSELTIVNGRVVWLMSDVKDYDELMK